ncbi:MAG TPA: glycosyltransferase family 2 protein [Methylomirabilota bacterium]|nr:glycosyltransferase family 2 protein [Methylomirabilota bacterium]
MSAPYFTVLIDSYNYGHYVEEAVSSVLAQDFPMGEREILVVDDGSTDDTAMRLRRFGNAIRYLRKSNGGQASAFNYGFAHARGEVVALLDADDVWLPRKLGRVKDVFERNPDVGMVYHRLHWWDGADEDGTDRYFAAVSGRVPESRRTLLEYPMASTSCLAFRRTAVEKLLPVPEGLRSQADAYLTALIIFVTPVEAVGDYLGKYRLHGANLFQTAGKPVTREQIKHRMSMRAALLAEIESWLERNGQNVRPKNLRAYLMQWRKAQEQDGFLLEAPGRWKYFRHLLGFPWTYGEIMTGRHRVYSYLRAYAALVLGYHHLYWFDEARRKRKEWMAASSEKTVVAVKAKAKAAAATKS